MKYMGMEFEYAIACPIIIIILYMGVKLDRATRTQSRVTVQCRTAGASWPNDILFMGIKVYDTAS